MGGGDDKKDSNPASKDALLLNVLSEYDTVPGNKLVECTIMAQIKAKEQGNDERRAPVTICAAIDRSASMKDKLPLVKESLLFMIQQLRHEDKVCLFAFDHEVSTLLPLTLMDSSGKAIASRAIKSISERGHTNLSGGLLAALQALYSVSVDDATLVESVLLFTDGKANYGIRDKEALAKATRGLVEQIGRQCCVFAMGYGADHDADMLHGIADAGHGLYYYIENKDNIPESFCDCLGGLLSVTAQNIQLTIQSCNGCLLATPVTSYTVATVDCSKVYTVKIPDIYCEEEKCVPVQVTLPRTLMEKDVEEVQVVSCYLEYFDVVTCMLRKLSYSLSITRRNDITQPTKSENAPDVEVQTLRCNVADNLVHASKMADKGDLASARRLLVDTQHKVKKSVAFGAPLCQYLMETVQESLEGLEDKTTYCSHGKPTMMNYSHSHWQQRSSNKPSKISYLASATGSVPAHSSTATPYTNCAKTKMKFAYTDIKFKS